MRSAVILAGVAGGGARRDRLRQGAVAGGVFNGRTTQADAVSQSVNPVEDAHFGCVAR